MGSSSFLESSILWLGRLQIPGSPRVFNSPAWPLDTVFRSPCILHLPALPAMVPRVSSIPASFSAAADEFPVSRLSILIHRLTIQSSGIPESCIFRVPAMVPRVSSTPASFGVAFVESTGFPGSPPQAAPLDQSPGLPGSCIFRLRRRWFFELPRVPHPSAVPSV